MTLDYSWLEHDSSTPVGIRPDWQVKKSDTTTYKANYTGTRFHLDSDHQVKGLMGPIGSGKSVACCAEIMRLAHIHPVDSTGKRRLRVVVVRNTFRELRDTTILTWLDWFPEDICGPLRRGTMTHEVRLKLHDGIPLELDVMFRALDRPADVAKLLSLEGTFAWVNEARELPLAIITMLEQRMGRFPSYKDPEIQKLIPINPMTMKPEINPKTGEPMGAYFSGMLMDTNPPDSDHWWHRIFEISRPKSWRLFRQPSALGPKAENLENLRPGYYSTAGKSEDWIKVYFEGEYGYVQDGRPVYPEYTDSFHCTLWADTLKDHEIRVGIDFGLTPAAVFVQQDIFGRWRCIDELVSDNMGIKQFAEVLNTKIQRDYAEFAFKFYGDPAGDQRAQTDMDTPFLVLRANGINASPARSNDFNLRREAVAGPLMKISNGKPALSIHPRCVMLRKGMAGKYCYKRVQVVGDERFHDKPDKGPYSHVCEAAQYVMMEFGSNPTLSVKQQAMGPGHFVAGGGDFDIFGS